MKKLFFAFFAVVAILNVVTPAVGLIRDAVVEILGVREKPIVLMRGEGNTVIYEDLFL